MAQFLIGIGLVDKVLLAKFQEQTSGDQLFSLLDQLVESGKLSSEQRELIDRFSEVVLADCETFRYAIDDTVGFTRNLPGLRDAVPHHVTSLSKEQAPTGDFGDYEIIDEIARGGMGVVYKARQISLNRTVALKKVLSGKLAGDEDIKRFQIEAEASANLDHPGIVPVHDFGEHDGQHYFSMGFVDGQSLSQRLATGPLRPREAAELLVKISRAVAYANAQGVIHRDLKPGNVLLDRGGEPRVTDFGLAKKEAEDSGMTATGQILGTPSFMPPEQAAGKGDEVDQRADVYALGAILYATLTGRPPFQAANVIETLKQVLEQEPISVRRLVPNVPRDLETICLKCLHKDARRRYETGDDFADDMQRWLGGEPIVARRVSRAERTWKWCKRKPLIAGAIATILLLVAVGSLVFWERLNASYADGLVQRLRTAEPGQVNEILDELPDYRLWTQTDLGQGYRDSREDSVAQLHFALALLPFEEPPLEYVNQRLLAVPPSQYEYIAVIGNALGKHRNSVVAQLWDRFRIAASGGRESNNSASDEAVRFHIGLALAHLDGESDRWTVEDARFLVSQFASTNPFVQPELLRLLTPLRDRLLEPLEAVFLDSAAGESQQLAAANALAFFFVAERNTERLARLLLTASGPQYNILYEYYQQIADAAGSASLETVVQRQPTDELDAASRIAQGKERAAAAITLLRQGERESMLDVLRYASDPEALTQFVHRCRERDVTPAELLELLAIVDQRRGPLDGNRQKVDDSVLYGLLLALGEFAWDDLPATRDAVVKRLAAIYAQDPSSGVHGATGWLLRSWGQQAPVSRVDQTPIAYDESGHREWYVQEIEYSTEGLANSFYLTFIVFQPGEFTIGSPDDEPHHVSNEKQHQATFTRPLAVCDRELTWAQWTAKDGMVLRDAFSRQFSKTLGDSDPMFGVEWLGAVSYCRWLSERAGISEDDKYYADLSSLPTDGEGNPTEWPLPLEGVGFRLPTEAEWEYVCRSNSRTAYSFGHDVELLDHYAWYQKNSGDWSKPTGALRPNPRGLFDLHGNVWEWSHDWEVRGAGITPDHLTRNPGARGGGWYTRAAFSRSSFRGSFEPSMRLNGLGFRVAAVPSSRGPEAQEPGSGTDSSGLP